MSIPEVLDHVIYHPYETRSPNLVRRNGFRAVATKVDDETGRAMLLFSDLTMAAAVPDEMRVL